VPVPTSEQDAVDAFASGDHLVLQAGAGTGKTTTLTMLAGSTRRQGRYLAFNRAIADEASAKFPSSVR
jgi:ABC-type transport system involved in cytochrome c biogenesis ATPase subunit